MPHECARTTPRRVGSRLLWLLAAVAALVASPAAAAAPGESRLDPGRALARSQAAVGGALGDWSFVDVDRRPVPLAAYVGKPLVVSLIYTGCTDVCPTISQSLYDAIEAAQETLGAGSFNVVTIGFDARADTPERMRTFARTRGLRLPDWTFLSGDAASIDGLARDLGFVFERAPHGFDHLQQTSVIDPEGHVYRQIYGAVFDPPTLVEPLMELTLGRRSSFASVDGLIDRIRLVCTVYNPNTRRYEFDISLFVAATGGGLSLLVIAVILVRSWRGMRRGAAVRKPS